MARSKRKSKPRSKRKADRPPAPLVSLSMIAKDESEFIGACLESVRGVADDIVVVDTGSQDNTVEIARNFGARVFQFSWCDDFSAARNYALAQCRGDWVLLLDADERLDPADRHQIRAAVNQPGVDAWYLRLINIYEGGPREGEVRLMRLFRKTPQSEFIGRIHEQLLQHLPNAVAGYCHASILHYGYEPSVSETRSKAARNQRLLELAVKETEDGANPTLRTTYLYYWALNSVGKERLKRLEEFAEYVEAEAARLTHRMACIPSGLVHYAAALREVGRHEESAAVARRVLEKFGEAPVLHAFIAGAHTAAGRLDEAEKELALALAEKPQIDRRHQEYVLPGGAVRRLSKLIQGLLREKQDRWADAESSYRELLSEMEGIRPRLAYVQMARGELAAALQTLEESEKPLDQVPPDLACLAFILSLIVQSGRGLLWWGEKVRLAAPAHPLCARVLWRVERWQVGRPFSVKDFPELPDLLYSAVGVSL